MADTPPPRRLPLKWALLASLGLNLIFVGLIAGALVKGPPPPPMPGLWQYARALPEPYRRDLGRALRDSRPDWAGPREALRNQQAAMAAALTAEPFDPGGVARVLEGETSISGDLSTRGRALLMAEIARMSPEERVAYAEALLANRGHGPGWRR